MKSCMGIWSIGLWVATLAAPAAAQFDEYEADEGIEEPPAAEETEQAEASAEFTDDAIEDELPAEGAGILWLSAGLKVGGGGNLLVAPDNPPIGAQPFDDGLGGYAFTFGPYVEARFLEGLLGFQTGLIFDFVTNLSELTLNGVDIDIGWSATDLRFPLLFQLGTPGDGTRLYVTTGPELVIALSADKSVEVAGSTSPLASQVTVNKTNHVNWVAGFGLASNISVLRVSFDVLFAYNLGVDSAYADRVTVGVPPSWTTDAQTNMDLRLVIGLGYDFGAIIK